MAAPLRLLLVPMMALLGASPAAALYKCTAADGSVAFQQTPCRSGHGMELEVDEAFGVRPATPASAAPSPDTTHRIGTADTESPSHKRHGPPVGQTPTGKSIYAGPRGGRYTVSASGRKNYLPRLAEEVDLVTATPPAPQANNDIHTGPRGGCYTIGSTGRKNYLPREQCPTN